MTLIVKDLQPLTYLMTSEAVDATRREANNMRRPNYLVKGRATLEVWND